MNEEDPAPTREWNEEDLTPFLEEVPRPPNFTFSGAWFRSGEDEIHLLAEDDTTGRACGGDPGPSAAVGLSNHLAFLDAACARLEEHGVAVIGGPMPRGDGVTQVFFHDRDGYVLALFQWTGEEQSDAPARAPIRG